MNKENMGTFIIMLMGAGVTATAIAIKLNMYLGTCNSYEHCTNSYVFVGLLMVFISILIKVIMRRYKINIIRKRGVSKLE